MPNIKFTEFPSATVVGSMDIIPIVQDGANKKTTASVFQTYIGTLFVNLSGTQTITGSKTFSSPLISNVATGTAPFSVASTTKVTNLNADLLDGLSSAAFQSALTLTTTGTSGAATLVGSTLNIPNYADNGITSLNGLTALTQTFAVGTSGTNFAISSTGSVHTFNLPTASATNRGALSSTDWTTFNNKQNALTNPITGTGTTNYLPKFTGTSALGNSTIFDNGSNVYLNTTTGTYRFEANAGSSQYINARFYGSSHSMIQVESTTAGFQALIAHKSPTGEYSVGLQGDGRYAIYHNTGAAERFTITSAGNVGIGTTSPVAIGGYNNLDIRGTSGSLLYMGIDGATASLRLIAEGTNAYIDNLNTTGNILFRTNNATERMRLTLGGNVLIGTTTDVASSKLTIESTTQGVLVPRMTTTQINAIGSPANGLIAYNTTLGTLCFYDGTGWRKVSHSAM